MSKENKPNKIELEYRSEFLDSLREWLMQEGGHGKMEAYPFTKDEPVSLSLEDRLKLAIMFGTREMVQSALELGADVSVETRKGGLDPLHLAEVHGRLDLLDLLKAYYDASPSDKKSKKINKKQK